MEPVEVYNNGVHWHEGANSTIALTPPVCVRVPPWYPKTHLVEFPSLILQLQMIVVYCLTQVIHHCTFKHIGLPPLASQLTAGVLLSPDILDSHLNPLITFHKLIFPVASGEVWKSVSILGFTLCIFIISVKTDITIIMKNGRKPVVIGLLVPIFTGIVNLAAAIVYSKYFVRTVDDQKHMRDLTSSASFLALSTFPVIALLLSDMKLLNSELGRLALSCGIVSELAGLSHNIAVQRVFDTIENLNRYDTKQIVTLVGKCVLGLLAFILSVIYILRPWMKKIIKHTPKGKPVKDSYVILIFLTMLVGGLMTHLGGEFVILGCAIVGTAVPVGPPLGSAIVSKFDTLVSGVLQPFFITMSVMRADVFKINFHDTKIMYGELLVTLTTFTSKIFVCLGCGLYYHMGFSDALALAAIMSSKGLVEIGIVNMFIDSKLVSHSTSAYLMLVTIVFAIIIPIIIQCLYQPLRKYAGYQIRDIVSCNPESHLRILSCISRPDDVPAIVHLLSLSNQTANRMILDVLHLIKLTGRAQPIYISHDLQEGNASENMSYSEDMISAFNSLIQKANMGDLFIHFFTTVTPPKAMHDDICTLALNNLASLIVLPFHRKLSPLDGSIEYEDNLQRTLNNSILERAPCSVGIFVNKGTLRLPTNESGNLNSVVVQSQSQSQSPEQNEFSAVVIFIGGPDDQEAIAYAKRMASGPKVWVLVIRLIVSNDESELTELDSKILAEIQEYKNIKPQFNSSEQVVQDGSQTAKMLRSIAEDFDLIIVGRSHKLDCPQLSGLQEWSEVRELGILGDILASPDFPGKTSLLVIQRQKQWKSKGFKYS